MAVALPGQSLSLLLKWVAIDGARRKHFSDLSSDFINHSVLWKKDTKPNLVEKDALCLREYNNL